jgi:hypothetical protein
LSFVIIHLQAVDLTKNYIFLEYASYGGPQGLVLALRRQMRRLNVITVVFKKNSILLEGIGLTISKNYAFFEGNDSPQQLLDYVYKYYTTHSTINAVFFCPNLTALFLKLIRLDSPTFHYEYFIQNGEVYSLNLVIKGKGKIILKCLDKFLGSRLTNYCLDEIADKGYNKRLTADLFLLHNSIAKFLPK